MTASDPDTGASGHPAPTYWRRISSVALLVFFLASATATEADHTEPLQILILTDTNQRSGPFVSVANSFSKELLALEARPVVLRYIDLNANDEKSISEASVYRLVMERVFHPAPPDLVVALGPPAVEFWQQNHGEAFRHVPVIAAAAEVGGVNSEFIGSQWAVIARFSFASQIEDVLQLLPDTRKVFLVLGASPHERKLAAVAENQLRGNFEKLEVDVSSGLSVTDLTDLVAQLEEGSVVYYVSFESDANGEILMDDEVLVAVSNASNVPVFGTFKEQLGLGIVGGRLIPLEKVGRELARQAAGILAGTPPEKGARYVDLSSPIYDWRQLKPGHIPIRRLPPGSEFLFEPPGLWASYGGWILSIALLNAAMVWLIIQLYIQRRRSSRQAKTNADLSGRLITAYEDERRLIAREMHDDVCQSLARLAIDASQITVGVDGPAGEEKLLQLQDGLARVSSYVHGLSYRIHPSMVEELGLAKALRAECRLIQEHTDKSIVVDVQDIPLDIPLPIRLNLYRIGQEALQNAIRHSGASRIIVELHSNDLDISLSVSDNGQGFDVSSANANFSLGLASMRERAAPAGGMLTIRSEWEKGTRVQISISAPGAGK